jgi:hypothetical protein
MRRAVTRPIGVPFSDDSIKVVSLRWTEAGGAFIDVLSKRSGRICTVTFEHVAGLRLLDELDLASVWMDVEKADLRSTWLFRVDEGGWYELESTRSDFYTQHESPRPVEFLVAGYRECVSILSLAEPVVHEPETRTA